jgi:hypothetical protein
MFSGVLLMLLIFHIKELFLGKEGAWALQIRRGQGTLGFNFRYHSESEQARGANI